MSEVLQLKRDPAWLTSLELNAETAIILQGDSPDGRVPVPAALLVASSLLVRNIMSSGHVPPAFSTPVITIPSVSVDILEIVGEMLFSGVAIMDRTKLCGVREVIKMMGIEDLMVIQTENVVNELGTHNEEGDEVRENIVQRFDVLDNLVNIKSEKYIQEDVENAEKFEIIVKHEKEPEFVNPDFLLNGSTGGYSSQSCLNPEKGENQTINEEPRIPSIYVQKKVQVRIARLKLTSNLEENCFENRSSEVNKGKSKNCSNISQKKFSRQSKKEPTRTVRVYKQTTVSCPQCYKKIADNSLSRHIRAVHSNETAQCPIGNKTLLYNSLKHHNRTVHKQPKKTFLHGEKKVLKLRKHSQGTAQCPHCDKTLLSYNSLTRHIKIVHKEYEVSLNSKVRYPNPTVNRIENGGGDEDSEELVGVEEWLAMISNISKSDKLYCYCLCPNDGMKAMIGCDAPDCRLEWFHFSCVGIMSPPEGKWYCLECTKLYGL